MPGAPAIDPVKAAAAMNFVEAGYSQNVAAELAGGLSRRSVSDIVNGHGRWGEIAERPVFARLRLQQQQVLEAAGRSLAAKALIQCEETLPKANAYQSCLIASIMIDKSRLLAGEATQIVEIQSKAETAGLDQFCKLLSQSLLADQAIDITPSNNVTEAQTSESLK